MEDVMTVNVHTLLGNYSNYFSGLMNFTSLPFEGFSTEYLASFILKEFHSEVQFLTNFYHKYGTENKSAIHELQDS